jgi:hypothetical protein
MTKMILTMFRKIKFYLILLKKVKLGFQIISNKSMT